MNDENKIATRYETNSSKNNLCSLILRVRSVVFCVRGGAAEF